MNVMTYQGYHATISYDEADEIFTGRLAGIADVIGFHADNVQALKQSFHNAVDDYIATCVRIGKEPNKPFSGRVMFRVDPTVHARAALAAELSGKSLNQWAEDTLRLAAEKILPAG